MPPSRLHGTSLGMSADLKRFIKSLGKDLRLSGEMVHLETIPAQAPALTSPDPPLPKQIAKALSSQGIDKLYSHQTEALKEARAGRDLVVSTPTASGKSLVYALPVLENLLKEPAAKALFLFPLKALEQDQLAALNELGFSCGLGNVAAVYDGDTPQGLRKKLRDKPPPILISNPDMVHAGICPFAGAWHEFLSNLRYVVIDEVHTYRGVFGSQVVQVLRRLLRLAAMHGARPQFILCSATVANPREHAQALTGRKLGPHGVVDQSGAPAASRNFALINPVSAASTTASRLFAAAIKRGLSTICFTKSRLHTELIHTWVTRTNPELRDKVAGYRAGFLPSERRGIERSLATGGLLGVVTTSALEMGIDIGELDVCILVGYPGSHISTWQRGGRVGRAGRDSLVALVANPDALDQYFLKHPQRFFERQVEAAVIDPDNPQIVGSHLVCAAAEEPLEIAAEKHFDLEAHAGTLQQLSLEGRILLDAEGERWFSSLKRPQRFIDLRGAGDTYAIVGPGGKVIGSLDGVRVFKEGYPGAVYLHRTKSYVVRSLDWEEHKVFVLPAEAAYYTRARSDKETEILEETGRRPVANFLVRQGRIKVTETVTAYERRHLRGGELLGVFPLDMPQLTFETHGLWIDIEQAVRKVVEKNGFHFMGSIHALEHAGIAMFPLFALCDRGDIGGISIPMHPQTKKAAVFIYDGVPGGVGLAERGFEIIEQLLQKVEELLAGCDCEEGCPACVYSPKCGSGNKPLDKAGALLLTRALLGKVDLEEATEEPAPMIGPDDEDAKSANRSPSFGVMDLETQRLAADVGGWGNSHLMMVSVGVVYDSRDDACHSYGDSQVASLIKALNQVDLVIGFNIIQFDYKVLSAYTPQKLSQLPTLDLLQDIHRRLGFRLSLQALGEATLNAGKSANGLQAVEWWRNGELEKLTSYCVKDVELTRDLFLFGQENGYVLYIDKQGNKLRIPVDWSWESLKKRFSI